MNRIHVLDRSTIDKIAAGEVVERPASVVKELTENALDAGAGRITIEIRDGGISLIRVTDNGHGIGTEDIPSAFLRHATSKISSSDDLTALTSYGFRGEALSSIAAVSRVELITRSEDDIAATRYIIEGGREKLREEIGAPQGTTIFVRDLFFNTPVRAGFLKTPMTEGSHVGSFVEQLILSNPSTAFTFLVNGQTKITSSGNGRMEDVIYHIYGRDIASRIIPMDHEYKGIHIRGYIGSPSISRGNRNFENYYVNGRYVRSRILMKGIEDGYGNRLMQHQYPFTCLLIEADPQVIDVNVHPTKMDVRFSDEKCVYEALKEAVGEALKGKEMIVASSLEASADKPSDPDRRKEKAPRPPEPFEHTGGASVLREERAAYGKENGEDEGLSGERTAMADRAVTPDAEADRASSALKEALLSETSPGLKGVRDERAGRGIPEGHFVQQTIVPEFLSREAGMLRRIVGEVFSTYWICEFDNKMYIFDQHAAHERVLYEKFMKEYENRQILSQAVSPPYIVTLDSDEEAKLALYGDAFTTLGFEIEPFGERDYAVHAVPYSLGTIDSDVLFRQLLDQLEFSQKVADMDVYIHRVATEACKAAVKGGEKLDRAQAARLLDDLMTCGDPYHCPHGRPTIISFSREDLERRFKRIVT